MTVRTLTILLLGLTVLSCNNTASKNESSQSKTVQKAEPDYNVAIQFINDYLDYYNDFQSEVGIVEWVNERTDVTAAFKTELQSIMEEAQKNDPELGLGFDPILDAQDSPDKFELDKTDSNYIIVRGVNSPEFRLTLQLKFVENKWLVDGSGIINVPESKRIKR